jgi:hypothetical protein
MPQTHVSVTEVFQVQEFLLGVLGSLDSAPKRLSFLRTILEIADGHEIKALDVLESRSFLYGAVAALDPGVAASLAKRHFPFGIARSCQTFPSLFARPDRLKGLKQASNDLLKLIASEAAKFPKQYQQPLQGSRATMNARDRNYSARSAKRKPLSGAATSSRKRSSTA